MQAALLSLATAVPPYRANQDSLATIFASKMKLDPIEAEKLKKFFKNSRIQNRCSVIDDYLNPTLRGSLYAEHFPEILPGTQKRNQIYKEKAPQLAAEAAGRALERWGGEHGKITHVISVSCTGVMVPGLEFLLIDTLSLSRKVKRLGINFMGCFGAFQGLDAARAYALLNPTHRVLLVCTELCSLHLQADKSLDTFIANSLFADGSAAVVVGAEPTAIENRLAWIERRHSYAVEETLEDMGWDLGDDGCRMHLSERVPKEVKRQMRLFAENLLESEIPIEACEWLIHPGGKAILQAASDALELSEEDLGASWQVLKEYGNMSSPSFLFILEKALKNRQGKKWGAGVGFGPGLSFEGLLLKYA